VNHYLSSSCGYDTVNMACLKQGSGRVIHVSTAAIAIVMYYRSTPEVPELLTVLLFAVRYSAVPTAVMLEIHSPTVLTDLDYPPNP
jgi:hypothetical protein